MRKVKYLDKADLIRLNDIAIKRNYNRAIQTEFVQEVGEDIKIPVVNVFPHNDQEWRLKLTMTNPFEPTTTITDADGNELEERPNWCEVWLDIPFKEYDNIKEMVVMYD
mgnify:CR=1 FL=1|tara:strand:- start:10 stop:336 length:327 start_codon:yes stop_codon:yes gene_type:complete